MLKNDVLLGIAPCGKFVLLNLNDGSIHFPNFDSSGDGMYKSRPLSEHSSLRSVRKNNMVGTGQHATARVESLEGIGWWQCVMYVPELDSFAIGGCVTQEEKQVVCFMGNMVKTRTEGEATMHGIEEGLQFCIEELYVDDEELTLCIGNKNLVQWIVGVKGTHGYRGLRGTKLGA
ncbi:hypothetical protein PIB30_087874 [Stylosanthes scabra]|uniref:Uncharacterized protein n=1 Tax=Stylosanthes scabra TaxID=79078 RepID=A0ABU6RTV6_9FABA|nr:hypothetical protein [Stylosanthes scabra]